MLRLRSGLALGLLCAASLQASAETILETTQSWDGGEIAYPDGQPKIVSEILQLQPGKTSPWHCHPVPTLGYILEGPARVETREGKSVLLQPGESAVEVMRTVHRGVALEQPVKILVFYAGEQGTPVTVREDSEQASRYCSEPEVQQ